MHPELCQLLPAFRSGKSDYLDGEAATLADTAEAFTITGKASRPPLPVSGKFSSVSVKLFYS